MNRTPEDAAAIEHIARVHGEIAANSAAQRFYNSDRQDAAIATARAKAKARGATPVEVERNVLALWGVA